MLRRLVAGAPGADSGGGAAKPSRDVDALADLGARAWEWTHRAAKSGNRERELLPRRQISADDRAQYRRRALTNSRGDRARFRFVALRKRERDQNPERARAHRGQVAEGCRGRAIADLEAVEPIAPEVDALHQCVGADDEPLTRGHVEDGGIVADPLRGFSPLREEDTDEVELLAGAEVDVAIGSRFVGTHRATAGSSANTGGSGDNSFSFHARGSAYSTSSSVVPRTYSQNSAARPCTQAAQQPATVASCVCASMVPAMPSRRSPLPPVPRSSCPSGDYSAVSVGSEYHGRRSLEENRGAELAREVDTYVEPVRENDFTFRPDSLANSAT